MGEIRILIKQQQQYNNFGQPIIFDGQNPASLYPVINGQLASSRKWQPGGWIDITEDCGDLNNLRITFTSRMDDQGFATPGVVQREKSAADSILIEGAAADLIRAWLVNDVSAPLNAVDVKFYDTACQVYYEDFFFAASDIEFCTAGDCALTVNVRQTNENYNCIQNTLIADNWQGWFQTQPANGKKHPRFSYCNEARPNGLLVFAWFNLSLMGTLLPLVLVIATVVYFIQNLINTIIAAIRALFGGNPDWPKWDFKEGLWDPILENYAQWYIEAAGCGREHPGPLIRDYIKNVCDKCGIEVDGDSAPIFFAQHMSIETSSRGVIDTLNHHYNACYLTPVSQRGVRRFKSLRIFGGQFHNNTDYFIPENAPQHTLDTFLNELSILYNADWRLKNNKLYIQRKDFYRTGKAIYNFTEGHADASKVLDGMCFQWNELKNPAFISGIYSQDAGDKPGNEALAYYNDRVFFNDVEGNPAYSGRKEILAPIGATKFRLDGAAEDYIMDAFQVVSNGSITSGIQSAQLFSVLPPFLARYCDYAILMQGETCTLPKVVIWDGENYEGAKATIPYHAHDNAGNIPPQNVNYNGDMHRWQDRHPPRTEVRGDGLTLPPAQAGYYLVTDYFGAAELKLPAKLPNYFMYFAQDFTDTLWDWFHWIDDPRRSPVLGLEFTVRMNLCCEDIARLGVTLDPVLGDRVVLPFQYYSEGVIREIEVNYGNQEITLTGTV